MLIAVPFLTDITFGFTSVTETSTVSMSSLNIFLLFLRFPWMYFSMNNYCSSCERLSSLYSRRNRSHMKTGPLRYSGLHQSKCNESLADTEAKNIFLNSPCSYDDDVTARNMKIALKNAVFGHLAMEILPIPTGLVMQFCSSNSLPSE